MCIKCEKYREYMYRLLLQKQEGPGNDPILVGSMALGKTERVQIGPDHIQLRSIAF